MARLPDRRQPSPRQLRAGVANPNTRLIQASETALRTTRRRNLLSGSGVSATPCLLSVHHNRKSPHDGADALTYSPCM